MSGPYAAVSVDFSEEDSFVLFIDLCHGAAIFVSRDLKSFVCARLSSWRE